MKMKRILATALAVMMAMSLAACGQKSEQSANSGSDTKSTTIHLWANGSDNVRQVFEALSADFNGNAEANQGYQVELNFLLSGTGGQSMPDMLAAACKSNQTNTEYDLVDLGGDDLSKVVSLVGTDGFMKLDKSKISNSSRVKAESANAAEFCQPYRGTTVVLAYNSQNVTEVPTTAEELYQWIKDHPGRFAYNVPGTGGAGDSFVRTTVYNYIDDQEAMTSDDPKWMDQWDEGFAKLVELHPYMYKSGGARLSQQEPGRSGSAVSGRDRHVPHVGGYAAEPACRRHCPRLHQDGHHSALLHWLCAEHADSQFWFQP